MPKFTSSTRRIQVGNRQYAGVLFVIPVIMTIQKHRFEIFTMVSEIHENGDLVQGVKNLFQLEGVIDSHDSCLSFLNRSIHVFQREKVEVKPKDLRSLGYYKLKQGVPQQTLSKMYHNEPANVVCDQFNRLINTLRQGEKVEGKDKYPWLDDSDERKFMTDKEILTSILT